MGYVSIQYSEVNSILQIECRGKLEDAVIIKPPFYKRATHK